MNQIKGKDTAMAELLRELRTIDSQIREIEMFDLFDRLENKLSKLEERREEIIAELEREVIKI